MTDTARTAPNLFDLSGRTAIVTGSSRGIGKEIARAFVEHGANVVISSRKDEACTATAEELNTLRDGAAFAQPANISSKDDLTRLVDATRSHFGKVDILVCNAASNPYFGPMTGIEDGQFDKILRNNILSTHWLIQMVAPEMTAQRFGAIVIVSSIGGMTSSPGIGAYNVSKAADLQLARTYAVELGRHNVRTNCIAPGLIRTDFAKALWSNPEIERQFDAVHPMGRMGEAREIAGAAVFLVSDAGSYVNGQTIVVDGGQIIV